MAASATVRRTNSSSRVGGRSQSTQLPELDFNGLEATIEIMDAKDPEYEDTCQIFLSSRYQLMAPFHRQYKDAQLITKAQWVEYWTQGVEDDKKFSRAVAAKIFDTCSFLGKGKSGVTPTGIDNLQKTLPRKYRSVTSAGANRQLSKYSWYANGNAQRDIRRPSQVLSPQKYEELIARLRAESERAREELRSTQRNHQREIRGLKDKLTNAKSVIKRLKTEIAEATGQPIPE